MNELKRFIAKVDRRGDNECWNWTATKDGHGYGQFYYMGRNMKAPRVAWIMKNGPIPKGLLVCHKCDNPSCVNPNHLFLGTMSDNIMDCVRKGRHPHPVGKGNNTHCPQGHPYSGDNLYVSPRGERRCLICQNNHYQKRKLKDKKALLASSPAPSSGPYSGDPATCECDYHKACREEPGAPAPAEISAKTCKSECGLRQRYPISCKQHDCRHLREAPAPEASKIRRGIKDLSDTISFNDGMDD